MAIVQLSRIQHRTGNYSDLPQLANGEIGWASDQRRVFIGNDPNIFGSNPDNTEILTQHSTLSAAGDNNEVQFNNNGVIDASSDFTFNPVSGDLYISGTYTNSGADIGERYVSDKSYEPGTVLMIGGEYEVTKATKEHQLKLIGVVSTEPAYVLNAPLEHSVIVALAGRVPCKVVGKIQKGDLLTISDLPGVATSTSAPILGATIGKSLQNYDSIEVGVVEIVVGRI
jgi:hypothetical protein